MEEHTDELAGLLFAVEPDTGNHTRRLYFADEIPGHSDAGKRSIRKRRAVPGQEGFYDDSRRHTQQSRASIRKPSRRGRRYVQESQKEKIYVTKCERYAWLYDSCHRWRPGFGGRVLVRRRAVDDTVSRREHGRLAERPAGVGPADRVPRGRLAERPGGVGFADRVPRGRLGPGDV